MDPFVLNLVLLSPLILGMVLSQFLRLNLKQLQGVYIFLTAANTLIHYFILGEAFYLPLIFSAVGFVALVILTAIFGTKVRPSDYVFAEVGIGMFPWFYWDFTVGFVYSIVLLMFAVLVALRPKFKNPFRPQRKG